MHMKFDGHETQVWPPRPQAVTSTPETHLFVAWSQQPPQLEELHIGCGAGPEHDSSAWEERSRKRNEVRMRCLRRTPKREGAETTDTNLCANVNEEFGGAF
jgi:hypothetical protein